MYRQVLYLFLLRALSSDNSTIGIGQTIDCNIGKLLVRGVMRCPLDLIVGTNNERCLAIGFDDAMVEWAQNTLGYIPKVYVVEGRIQIWLRSRDDYLLYVMFTGQKDYINLH